MKTPILETENYDAGLYSLLLTNLLQFYFQFYGYLSQQQNMLQDYVRTSTYQRAVLANSDDFRDKVVLDVGAGSGILSFFSVQAGAKRVYAVEASSMALHAEVGLSVSLDNRKYSLLTYSWRIVQVVLTVFLNLKNFTQY